MSYLIDNVKGIDLVKHVDPLPEELCSDGVAIAKGGYYCLTAEGNKTREQTSAKDKCRYNYIQQSATRFNNTGLIDITDENIVLFIPQ